MPLKKLLVTKVYKMLGVTNKVKTYLYSGLSDNILQHRCVSLYHFAKYYSKQ